MATIVWDYDGTLHDSLSIYAPAVRTVFADLEKQGLVSAIPEEEEIRSWIGLRKSEMWRQAAPHLDEKTREASALQVGSLMQTMIDLGEARLYPGALTVLAWVKRMGFTQLMLTNAGTDYLNRHRELFRLDEWFDGYYWPEGCDGLDKKKMFCEIREKHEGPWIMIGDRDEDMEAARSNSGLAIGCLYGYGSKEELAGADSFLYGIAETADLLSELPLGTVMEEIVDRYAAVSDI